MPLFFLGILTHMSGHTSAHTSFGAHTSVQAHMQVLEHIQELVLVWEYIQANIQARVCAVFFSGSLYEGLYRLNSNMTLTSGMTVHHRIIITASHKFGVVSI